MRVLGISPLDKDSSVSFMEDGQIVFACGEERLSRVKLQSGFPHQALKLGLERTGWTPESIDTVAYAFFDGNEEARLIHEAAAHDKAFQSTKKLRASADRYRALRSKDYELDEQIKIPGLESKADEFMPPKTWWKRAVYEATARVPALDHFAHGKYFGEWVQTAVADHGKWSNELEEGLDAYGLKDKLKRFQHHDTHAANAFYASGFDDALCLVLDGYGSGCCGGVYRAGASGITNLHRYRFPYSLGIFYEQVTSALGFRPSRHEGKIVGLAAYGRPELLSDLLKSRFECEQGDIKILGAQNYLITRAMALHFSKRDIAAAYQSVLEYVACQSASYWLKKTGLKRVVMSGGVHANVKLNQRIFEIDEVESVFIYPNMGDGGCGSGAAMLAFEDQMPQSSPLPNAYLGPDYSDKEIRSALEAESLTFEDCGADLERRVAEVLADDGIVARFNGRMEYGPRALGNRSILYPAKDPAVNQWLNDQLGRTEFMPFAPSVLAEDAPSLFVNMGPGCAKTSEFMTVTFDCTEAMKQHSPAAVHVDGTARPQLVTAESNPSFHGILTHYKSLTGIPVLINTSFNMHEEPIVGSPADAVRAFMLGNIDYLAIGTCLVPHPKRRDRLALSADASIGVES
ncbi:Decarbamoylnovobiocin carbamoyltransferase [Roseimaritima multifibrata]|uniref:Decarbamoylnovobiocin carbamoyltransferase n=1 Tax=Roseimaritima multifibrata TaxID=1930274 RepID=A0A517MNA3_9BACT|nr:carbamoyltransferase C-terminal domain-containing protein [Roseimaritima multifibrata]QDS96362.1 Decarbamoylnovobiocin carbamoyltransferase [Roseimaritima multifibrata]